MIDYEARRNYMNGPLLDYIKSKDLEMIAQTLGNYSESNAFPTVSVGPLTKNDIDRCASPRGYDQITDTNNQCDVTYIKVIHIPGSLREAVGKTLKVGGLRVAHFSREGLNTDVWTLQEHSYAVDLGLLRSQGYFYETIQYYIGNTYPDVTISRP